MCQEKRQDEHQIHSDSVVSLRVINFLISCGVLMSCMHHVSANRLILSTAFVSSPSCSSFRCATATSRTTTAPLFVAAPIPKATRSGEPNDWGIPDSQTLEPLSDTPIDQLPNGGKITLVGSGPGDPELLTVSAYKLLTSQQQQSPGLVVIADRLVSPEILDLIDTTTNEIKVARKLPGCADLAQEEIYYWAYQALQQGKHVVRLKIGDPFVFGRGGEEVLTFRKFGIEPKVVPGVSAAFSAPLLGSIPVTHRGVSNQVVMCTGYGRDGTSPDLIQYHKEQTIVFLMAVGRLRELCQRLVTMAGYPIETPVAIIEKAGCPSQRTVVGTMETIADMAEEYQIKPPSTIVVGGVVNVLLECDDETGVTVTGLVQNMTEAFI